jgi:hypothetical protein
MDLLDVVTPCRRVAFKLNFQTLVEALRASERVVKRPEFDMQPFIVFSELASPGMEAAAKQAPELGFCPNCWIELSWGVALLWQRSRSVY